MKTRITLTVQWDSDQDGPNHGQTPHEAIAELCNSEIFDAYAVEDGVPEEYEVRRWDGWPGPYVTGVTVDSIEVLP